VSHSAGTAADTDTAGGIDHVKRIVRLSFVVVPCTTAAATAVTVLLVLLPLLASQQCKRAYTASTDGSAQLPQY
jgi:hypothetical protein